MLTKEIQPDGSLLWSFVAEPEPEVKDPEIPPECWNPKKPDAQRCIEAVRAMCK